MSVMKPVVFGVVILLGLVSCSLPSTMTLTSTTALSPSPSPMSPVTLTPATSARLVIDVGDGGFLSGEPCGPPCFWGITPGETREAEVVEILQERGAFEACEMFDSEDKGGYRGLECGSRVIIGFERGGDVVDGVGFNPSGVTVQEVVAKYGEPESVQVGALGVHVLDYQLILAYPKMLTLVRLSLQQEYPYVLRPETPVKNIVYDLEFGGEFSLDGVWHGYGEYP